MSYSIEKVTTLIGARRYGDCDAQIGFVLTDSRSLCFPEETLFFALMGLTIFLTCIGVEYVTLW